MRVEDLVRQASALSIEDRAALRRQLRMIATLETSYLAAFEVENKAYGKIEGTLYFEPLLREVCNSFRQKSYPEDQEGRCVNDGPTTRATGDGIGGIRTYLIDGPVDGGTLIALDIHAHNMLSDSSQYEDLFHEFLKMLGKLIEDRVIRSFEDRTYLGPNHLEERTLRYRETLKDRRDSIWRPPLSGDHKLPPGRPSKKAEFQASLNTAIERLRERGSKITQEAVAESMGYENVRSLTKRLKACGLEWRKIKNKNQIRT